MNHTGSDEVNNDDHLDIEIHLCHMGLHEYTIVITVIS